VAYIGAAPADADKPAKKRSTQEMALRIALLGKEFNGFTIARSFSTLVDEQGNITVRLRMRFLVSMVFPFLENVLLDGFHMPVGRCVGCRIGSERRVMT
jgi:hypothetical protein